MISQNDFVSKCLCFYEEKIEMYRKEIKIFLFLLPIMFGLFAVYIKANHDELYRRFLIREDGAVEDMTAALYFGGFLISLNLSLKFLKGNFSYVGIMYLVFSIGLLFIGLEEISWGQRILGINTPEYFTNNNRQKELNLHNIEGFPLHSLYIIVGLYGSFGRMFVPKKIRNQNSQLLNLFFPNWYLFLYFFIVAALYMYYEYFSSVLVTYFGDQFGWGPEKFIHGKDQEPAEFLLGMGFLLFVTINYYRQLSGKFFG